MYRGVTFEALPGKNILSQILNLIDAEKYSWYNILGQNEVWANYDGGVSLDQEYYDGKSFLQNICAEHFVIFLKLQAYYKNSEFLEVHTYDEFQNSDCQLLLLINDCAYVSIYAKDQMVIESIYEDALNNNYNEVQFISDSSDRRTKMDVI